MLGAIISLILLFLVLGFLWWAFQQLVGLVPLAEPFPTLIRVLFGLVILLVVIYAVQVILGEVGTVLPFPRIR